MAGFEVTPVGRFSTDPRGSARFCLVVEVISSVSSGSVWGELRQKPSEDKGVPEQSGLVARHFHSVRATAYVTNHFQTNVAMDPSATGMAAEY
jgi:hypothetical protein